MKADATVLRSLVQTTIDSAEGYQRAADHASTAPLKEILNDAAAKRRRLADALNAELVRLGEARQEEGSTAGSVHRTWVQITTAFKDRDEAAVERVEEGEDYIKEKFEKALENKDWQPMTREVLQKAHAEIAEGERLTDRLEEVYD